MLRSGQYNGWKNWQTWNVALWLNNDEHLYNKLVSYARHCKKLNIKPTYSRFIDLCGLVGLSTGDSVAYINSRVCRRELSELLFDGLI
jgi:hypothetical protein